MIISKKSLTLQPFVIPVKGLKDGRTDFDWHADGEFFGSFENSEIQDANLQVKVSVMNNGDSIESHCEIEGTVTVICDRCLSDLVIPVSVFFDEDDTLDLSQDIYDYVCTSLPIQRVHNEGECDPETIKYLNK